MNAVAGLVSEGEMVMCVGRSARRHVVSLSRLSQSGSSSWCASAHRSFRRAGLACRQHGTMGQVRDPSGTDPSWRVTNLNDSDVEAQFRAATEPALEDIVTRSREVREWASYRLYASEWGLAVRMRGGRGRLGQVTPPVWRSTRNR